jgi:catechol 2,3-dioxygenase-like lactoylglutathione lyase family enzyme
LSHPVAVPAFVSKHLIGAAYGRPRLLTRPNGGSVITKTDFIGIPSTDAERSRGFYVDTLGLRPDEKGRFECWAGDTCFGIWEPAKMGMEFAPQKNAHPALHVDDVAAARAELEAKGVEFNGETFDTGVCHMALFTDPDGNDLMLHNRYAPYEQEG